MDKYKILILFGKSGAGKDFCLNEILNNDTKNVFNRIIRCTTRPPRENETNGIDYFFLTPEEFSQQVLDGQIVEAYCFNGWHYGTPIYTLKKDKINVGENNIFGIQCLLEDSHFDVKTLHIQASNKSRLLRCLNREQNPDCKEICRRFLADEKDFIDAADYANFVFITDDEEKRKISFKNLISIIRHSWGVA